MLPILFHIGSFPLRSWGLLLMIAFLMGAWRASKAAPRYGIKVEDYWDASLAGLFGGVLGGRLGYVLQNLSTYLEDPKKAIFSIAAVWQGGMTSFGGLLGGIAVGLYVCKKKGMNLWDAIDLGAPSLAIGMFFGRIGCLLNGCCYGHKCELPWAMDFHPDEHTAILGVHPTQLYEALGVAIAYVILISLEKRRAFRGQIFLAFCVLYGTVRFVVEIWREQSGVESIKAGLSTGQWASLGVALIAVAAWPLLAKKNRIV